MSGRTGFSIDLSQTYSTALAHYIVFTKPKMSSVALENKYFCNSLENWCQITLSSMPVIMSVCLGFCQTYSGPEEVVTACYRRCLSYPLYRHWKLTARVFRDVRHIFSAGQLTFEMDFRITPYRLCVLGHLKIIFC